MKAICIILSLQSLNMKICIKERDILSEDIRFSDYSSQYSFKERAGPGFQKRNIKFSGFDFKNRNNSVPDNRSEDTDIFKGKNKTKKDSLKESDSYSGTENETDSSTGKFKYSDDNGKIPGSMGSVPGMERKQVSQYSYKTDSKSEKSLNGKGSSSAGKKTGKGIKASGDIKYYTGSKIYGTAKGIGKKGLNVIKKEDDYGTSNIYRKEINGLKDIVKKIAGAIISVVGGAVASPILISILICILLAAVTTTICNVLSESEITINAGSYPESVLQWQSFVVERCEANNDPESDVDLTKFTAAILATIWQESGGNSEGSGGDLMQCSACGLWDTSAMPSDWTTEQQSIDTGIRYFYQGLKTWNVTDPNDFTGLQIVAQGYNYGYGYLTFMSTNNYNTWTLDTSITYSDLQAAQHGYSSYGTVRYGEQWLEKYQTGATAGSAAGSEEFQNMITEAEKYLGKPYVFGGKTPETSFDCSGFVCWVINNSGNGWNIGYKDANGLRQYCTEISESEAQPGDLVFFHSTYGSYGTGYATHVGIYTGNGNMIHSGSSTGVAYKDFKNSSYHQQHFLCYGRLPFMSMTTEEDTEE